MENYLDKVVHRSNPHDTDAMIEFPYESQMRVVEITHEVNGGEYTSTTVIVVDEPICKVRVKSYKAYSNPPEPTDKTIGEQPPEF